MSAPRRARRRRSDEVRDEARPLDARVQLAAEHAQPAASIVYSEGTDQLALDHLAKTLLCLLKDD